MDMLYVCIKDQHYFRDRDIFTIPMVKLWFLFNMDAIDVSFISCICYTINCKINATVSHI
jgi:hypothetical protein